MTHATASSTSDDLRLPLGAITDEFSPDLDVALPAMAALGMTWAELRVVWGKNVIDLTDEDVDRARAAVEAHGMRVLTIASPLLKCTLPGGSPIDPRIQQDQFGAQYTFEDQPRLTRRAFEIAARSGAKVIRVFSYWRTVDPNETFDAVVMALQRLAQQAQERGLTIGLENEHACNVATGEETGRLLAAIPSPDLKAIWDPANALVAGEAAFPGGYSHVPPERIVDVHAKDCRVQDHTPVWGPIGEMTIDWAGQIDALIADGYRGPIDLETHWTGPNGNKFEASQICGRKLRDLLSAKRGPTAP
jgi:sugar phosphate isomerase/epimerase